MCPKTKIAVLASGNGSNAQNLVEHFRQTQSGAEVALIITNKPDAPVLKRAEKLGVEAVVMSKESINDPAAMESLLDSRGIDFIVLAGFLLMVPDFLVSRFDRRIVNIHPSLLPKFGGRGMYGSRVHRAVVDAREPVTGITVHYVSPECDGGDIIFQAAVAVDAADTPADVENKVHLLEREHFPRIVEHLATAAGPRR